MEHLRPYEPVTEVLYQNIVISNVELERMKHLGSPCGLPLIMGPGQVQRLGW